MINKKKYHEYYKTIGRCNGLIMAYNAQLDPLDAFNFTIKDFSVKVNRTSYESIFTMYFFLIESINKSLNCEKQRRRLSLSFLKDYVQGSKHFNEIPREKGEQITWKFIESPMRD